MANTQKVELAVDKLEAMVNQAEDTLNSISVDLSVELSQKTGRQYNPEKILTSIEELKQELRTLKNDAENVIKSQEEVKNDIDRELKAVCQQLKDMEAQSGCKISQTPSTLLKMHFEGLEKH